MARIIESSCEAHGTGAIVSSAAVIGAVHRSFSSQSG